MGPGSSTSWSRLPGRAGSTRWPTKNSGGSSKRRLLLAQGLTHVDEARLLWAPGRAPTLVDDVIDPVRITRSQREDVQAAVAVHLNVSYAVFAASRVRRLPLTVRGKSSLQSATNYLDPRWGAPSVAL